eukprot:1910940-Pleurochrysis_carterae.AAC.1
MRACSLRRCARAACADARVQLAQMRACSLRRCARPACAVCVCSLRSLRVQLAQMRVCTGARVGCMGQVAHGARAAARGAAVRLTVSLVEEIDVQQPPTQRSACRLLAVAWRGALAAVRRLAAEHALADLVLIDGQTQRLRWLPAAACPAAAPPAAARAAAPAPYCSAEC